jgi:hypothetical protein
MENVAYDIYKQLLRQPTPSAAKQLVASKDLLEADRTHLLHLCLRNKQLCKYGIAAYLHDDLAIPLLPHTRNLVANVYAIKLGRRWNCPIDKDAIETILRDNGHGGNDVHKRLSAVFNLYGPQFIDIVPDKTLWDWCGDDRCSLLLLQHMKLTADVISDNIYTFGYEQSIIYLCGRGYYPSESTWRKLASTCAFAAIEKTRQHRKFTDYLADIFLKGNDGESSVFMKKFRHYTMEPSPLISRTVVLQMTDLPRYLVSNRFYKVPDKIGLRLATARWEDMLASEVDQLYEVEARNFKRIENELVDVLIPRYAPRVSTHLRLLIVSFREHIESGICPSKPCPFAHSDEKCPFINEKGELEAPEFTHTVGLD